MTEYALRFKLVDGTSSTHSFNPYACFGRSGYYFDIQNLRLAILYVTTNDSHIPFDIYAFIYIQLTFHNLKKDDKV